MAAIAAVCLAAGGISVPALGSIGDHADGAGAERRAARTGVLTISPARPRVGQLYRVAGRATSGDERPVRLQVLDPGGSWRAKGRAVTTPNGAFRFSWSSDRTQRLRVVAPRVGRTQGRAAQLRWVSRVTVVSPRSLPATPGPRPTPTPTPTPTPAPTPTPTQPPAPVVQTVALAAPPFALEQQRATLTASVAPAVAGRGVVLQRQDGVAWTTVASAPTDASGVAAFAVDTAAAGSVTYRAVVEATSGVLEAVSPSVLLQVMAGLPRVDITTDDGLGVGAQVDRDGDDDIDQDDKFAYTHGSLTLDPRGSGVPASEATSRFRVRGNATAYALIKLSYKVKLDKKATLLGLPKSKDWVLLANFYDRSLLRTDLAFEVSRRVGLAWTPTMVSVELWQNGHYAGVYQLGEGIEVDPDRVDLDVPDVTAADFDPTSSADGGYLLEADYRDDTDPQFSTTHGLKLHLKEPQGEDFASQTDLDTYLSGVQESTQALEDALYSTGFKDPTNGYRKYVDVASFINWYFVNELMKNHDSAFAASVWFSRDHEGKLAMGPAWDFDQSSGARTDLGLGDPTGWFLRKNWYPLPDVTMMTGPQGHWLNRMFEDPWFVDQVRQRWAQVRPGLLTLPSHLRAEAEALAPAATRNFSDLIGPPPGYRLPIGWTFLEPDGIFFSNWSATVNHVDYWLSDRLAWMDGQLHTGA